MRKFWALVAALMMAAGVTVLSTGTAQAVWQCYTWSEGNPATRANARCDFGLGGVRVVAYCWNGLYDVGPFYGPWKSAGQTSTVICGGGKVVDGAWYETW